MASTSAAQTESCRVCDEPLIIENPSNTSVTPTILIDDVLLPCSHHFHWPCIIDHATNSPKEEQYLCPYCRASTLDAEGEYLVTVRNEGGVIRDFNLGEEITREVYLENNPQERRKNVFLDLMAQGEHSEAEKFLAGQDSLMEEGEGGVSPDVCYEGGSTTAMHVAALNDDVTGVSLLLRYGADKGVRTEDGFTALDLARSQGADSVVALLEQTS